MKKFKTIYFSNEVSGQAGYGSNAKVGEGDVVQIKMCQTNSECFAVVTFKNGGTNWFPARLINRWVAEEKVFESTFVPTKN